MSDDFSVSFETKFLISAKIILLCGFLSFVNVVKLIKIDNLYNESIYQNNQDFSQFNTKHKILAIYYPQNEIHKENYLNKNTSLSLIKEKEEINNPNKSLIEKEVNLARNHGIFGFGIVYNWMSNQKLNEEIFNYFFSDDMYNFPFFIIFNSIENYNQKNQNSLIQHSIYCQMNINITFDKIKKYFLSENYIKLKGKPIVGIFNSNFSLDLINHIRTQIAEDVKESIYIISISYGNPDGEISNITNFSIDFPSKEIGLENNLTQKYFYNFYYNSLIKEENITSKCINDFFIINGCQPEKFYIIFRKYLNLTNPKEDTFLLFNAWNNYQENSYLEASKEFGFAYLNYFSKAIFNLDKNSIYELEALNNKCKIAIQVHLFYEDLIQDIINKTNNIPVKFDLYITIISPDIYNNLTNYIKKFSKANNFEILIVENRGRDILPFLKQIKTKFRQYKYLCHIHTKKSQTVPEIGFLWRNYLFNNLLGDRVIISEILNDFENNKKLGFIFPETFYQIIKPFYILSQGTKNWMDFLANKLFINCKIDEQLDFPAGNMFWAKIGAIFQIFLYDLSESFPNEDNQIDSTIMHGIERIWLYLVKYNRFYYKIIFKFF